MTPARAISTALAKVAQDLLDLPLQVSDLQDATRNLADLPEMLEDLSLLAVIEGPSDALGLIALPPATLQALIEMRTMGRLGKASQGARKPTRIDAAMAADFIDSFLTSIESSLIEEDAISWAGGFRYASHLDDPRPLGLLLEDVSFRVWTARFQLGEEGTRSGGLLWAVPQKGRGAHLKRERSLTDCSDPGRLAAALAASRAPPWDAQIERAVLSSPAKLEAVLHRLTLPLSAVLEFQPGMDLPLPAECLEHITLEGQGRRRLSCARLGQSRGNRALRLTGPEPVRMDRQSAASDPATSDPATSDPATSDLASADSPSSVAQQGPAHNDTGMRAGDRAGPASESGTMAVNAGSGPDIGIGPDAGPERTSPAPDITEPAGHDPGTARAAVASQDPGLPDNAAPVPDAPEHCDAGAARKTGSAL